MSDFMIICSVVLELLRADRRPIGRHMAKLIGSFLQLVLAAIAPAGSPVNTTVKQFHPFYYLSTCLEDM
jgi:hypothetical protein